MASDRPRANPRSNMIPGNPRPNRAPASPNNPFPTNDTGSVRFEGHSPRVSAHSARPTNATASTLPFPNGQENLMTQETYQHSFDSLQSYGRSPNVDSDASVAHLMTGGSLLSPMETIYFGYVSELQGQGNQAIFLAPPNNEPPRQNFPRQSLNGRQNSTNGALTPPTNAYPLQAGPTSPNLGMRVNGTVQTQIAPNTAYGSPMAAPNDRVSPKNVWQGEDSPAVETYDTSTAVSSLIMDQVIRLRRSPVRIVPMLS
ncbi:hypothetical protein BCR34DRAFT_589720 [Clohesyomyces aquaticus]|uniref:Uncharacterized protein n=1 Tax=Clohesyomyces aquaticus TaxID=1231657 RepID=A0A1Y1ZF39_9PLEO|nr:hypothetical protein BCR34DRAFT_589720 [Clohesyomyces aquaticus]